MKRQSLFIPEIFAVNLVFSAIMISIPMQSYAQETNNKDQAASVWHESINDAYQLKAQGHQILKKDLAHAETVKNQVKADFDKDIQRAKDRVQNAEPEDFDAAISDAIKIKNDATTRYNNKLAEVEKLKSNFAHAEMVKNQAKSDFDKDIQRAKDRVQNAEPEDFDAAISDAIKIKNDATTRYNNKLAEVEKLKSKADKRFSSNLAKAKEKVDAIGLDAEKKFDQDEANIKSLVYDKKAPAKKAYNTKVISLAGSGEQTDADLANIKQLPKRIENTELSSRSIPLQDVPERPDTLFHLGDSFFGEGPISKGFKLPTGAVWQPQFFPFGTFSTAVQISDNGDQQVSEWVNALDIYGNLNLTPTERLLIGFTPFDNDGHFSGYNMYPQGEGVDATNGHVQVLFFEGRFDSLFPGLKSSTGNWASFDFALGRQPVSYQSGILINDTIDSIGITRTSLNLFGSPEVTITGLFGWNFINRGNDNQRDDNAQLLGMFSTFNYAEHQIEADIVVVYDVDDSNPSNGLNFALSSYQQLWGVLNTTFSYNQSISLNQGGTRSQTGAVLLSQFNLTPPYTVDNAYMNVFWGIGNFTSAARNANAGGPLGQTGILFSATGLGDYGPALPNDGQNMFGGSIGYERYLGSIHRRVILEFGGVSKDSAIAFGGQFEQAFGSNYLLTLGSYVSYQKNHIRSVGYGVRSVFTVNF